MRLIKTAGMTTPGDNIKPKRHSVYALASTPFEFSQLLRAPCRLNKTDKYVPLVLEYKTFIYITGDFITQ